MKNFRILKGDAHMFHGVGDEFLIALRRKAHASDKNAKLYYSSVVPMAGGEIIDPDGVEGVGGIIEIRKPEHWMVVGERASVRAGAPVPNERPVKAAPAPASRAKRPAPAPAPAPAPVPPPAPVAAPVPPEHVPVNAIVVDPTPEAVAELREKISEARHTSAPVEMFNGGMTDPLNGDRIPFPMLSADLQVGMLCEYLIGDEWVESRCTYRSANVAVVEMVHPVSKTKTDRAITGADPVMLNLKLDSRDTIRPLMTAEQRAVMALYEVVAPMMSRRIGMPMTADNIAGLCRELIASGVVLK